MSYRYLGRSGLKVSRLALGTMMFGGPTDEPTSHEIIARAKARGVNFIDTADVYQKGRTEEVVGRAIRHDRDDWVLATKFANPLGEGPNDRGTSRKWIIQAVEGSLRRLGTDYLDILYFHRADFNAPLGEAVRAIGDLIRAGKLRYFGVSNFRGWRIAEAAHLADAEGIDRPVASQPLYNLVNRSAEAEQLPAAAAYGVVVSYSPLARGVLTAKYEPDQPPAAGTRGAPGQAIVGNGVASGIAAHRPPHPRLPRHQGHRSRAIRAGLGAQQPAGDQRHRRPAHHRAMGVLRQRARLCIHGRGRGAGGQPGGRRPSVHARLHRSRTPGGRPRALRHTGHTRRNGGMTA